MRQKARISCPFFGLTPLCLMDTTAIDGCQPCCNVPRRYSQVKGRPPIKFAFRTAYSQCNGRRWALNFQQKCSHFKRQSHRAFSVRIRTVPEIIGNCGCCRILLNLWKFHGSFIGRKIRSPLSPPREGSDMMSAVGMRPTWIERRGWAQPRQLTPWRECCVCRPWLSGWIRSAIDGSL